MIYDGAFGSCCKDLKDAMGVPTLSTFCVEENGVLYVTVGYAEKEEGKSWSFDHAVIFCPFCGKQLQTREEIKRKTQKK